MENTECGSQEDGEERCDVQSQFEVVHSFERLFCFARWTVAVEREKVHHRRREVRLGWIRFEW